MDDQLTTGTAPRRQPAQNGGGDDDGAPIRQSRRGGATNLTAAAWRDRLRALAGRAQSANPYCVVGFERHRWDGEGT